MSLIGLQSIWQASLLLLTCLASDFVWRQRWLRVLLLSLTVFSNVSFLLCDGFPCCRIAICPDLIFYTLTVSTLIMPFRVFLNFIITWQCFKIYTHTLVVVHSIDLKCVSFQTSLSAHKAKNLQDPWTSEQFLCLEIWILCHILTLKKCCFQNILS